MLAVVVVHAPAVGDLIEFWRLSLVYDYGALVYVCLALLVAVEVRGKPGGFRIRDRSMGLLALAFGLALALASVAKILLAQMLLLPLVVLSVLATMFGTKALSAVLFPFSLIVFALPVWDVLIGPLQQLTVAATSLLLELTGRTAFIQGDMVYLPYGSFVVERGCSGLNYVLAGAILGGAYAYAFLNGVAARVLAVISALLLAVIANWTRVYLIVLAGDLSHMQHGLVDDHIGFGWLVFGIMLSCMFFIGPGIQRIVDKRFSSTATTETAEPAPSSARLRWRTTGFLGVAALILLPPGMIAVAASAGSSNELYSADLPDALGDWTRVESTALHDHAPVFPEALAMERYTYSDDNVDVQLWLHHYRLSRTDPELVAYPNAWFKARHWRVTRTLDTQATEATAVRGATAMMLTGSDRERLLLVGYWINNRLTASRLEAKLYRVAAVLTGNPFGTAVTVSIDCSAPCVAETAAGTEFLTALFAALHGRPVD